MKGSRKYIPTEDGQPRRNGQVNLMVGSRTSTYLLKTDKKKWSCQLHGRVKNKHIPSEDGEMIRSTSWKGQEQHIPSEDAQTRKNGQVNFMKGSRTSTYQLKMEKWSGQLHGRVKNKHIPSENGEMVGQLHGRVKNKHIPSEDREMVRPTSWKGQEQAHTS